MATNPTAITKSPLHLIAQMTARDDKAADELEGLLKAVQTNAKGEEEPDCGRYDVLRYGEKFVVVEMYKDAAAVDHHNASAPFQTLFKSMESLVVPGTLKIEFFAEV